MSQAEKTMLRYQYVMAQTTNAQGDFTRTAKTWHNSVVVLKQQLQQLAAVIGSGLIQALKPFVNAMNNALSGLIKFAQNVVNALGKIFGWEMEVNTSGLQMDEDAYDVIARYTKVLGEQGITAENKLEGGKINMCKGMEDWLAEERMFGIEQGIRALILDNLEEGKSTECIMEKLVKRFELTEDKATEYLEKYKLQ